MTGRAEEAPAPPQFTLMRSDTMGVTEVSDEVEEEPKRVSRLLDKLKIHSGGDKTLEVPGSPNSASASEKRGRRLSNSLRIFSRSRSTSRVRPEDQESSEYVPRDLMENDQGAGAEELATKLALVKNEEEDAPGDSSSSALFSKEIDNQLQEAIDLHEAGHLEDAAVRFKKLADPHGANHPLAQVLYGLALRHGWGCPRDEESGFTFLRKAASNSALLEKLSADGDEKLSARNKKGLAKGELVLAIYELGNCFRYGWGCDKDQYAAKTYYETAAKLGDVDAMVEIAWCHLEGFGTKKDKHKAARYYRMAEDKGRYEVGNSWIWKDKYN
jgi:TPR repeat protein